MREINFSPEEQESPQITKKIIEEERSFLVRKGVRSLSFYKLVKKAEDWKWSSLYRRENGNKEQKKLLNEWPIDVPRNYLNCVGGGGQRKAPDPFSFSINGQDTGPYWFEMRGDL